jgi:putative transposase
MLPLGLGYVEGVTHDYRRHATTTLFAALDTANDKVLTQCRPRHRHQEYLGFLREIENNVPKNLEVHVIVDNYATHKHRRVKRWFAARSPANGLLGDAVEPDLHLIEPGSIGWSEVYMESWSRA